MHSAYYICMTAWITSVQVNPLYDQNGGTALMAANILFEMLCVLPGVKYLDFSGVNWNTFHF